MKVFSAILLFVYVCTATAFSQVINTPITVNSDDYKDTGNYASFLDNSFDARLGLPVSISPDYACMRMSKWNGKWKNMLGNSFGLTTIHYNNWTASANISAFVEIHDVTEGQFMSWQCWRGNLGASLYLENQKLNKLLFPGSRLVLQAGWYHESQHVTDAISYAYTFLNSTASFDNASLRSFEHYTLQLHFLHSTPGDGWKFYLNAGHKYYPQPLLLTAHRTLEHAWLFEAGIHKKIDKHFTAYTHGYFEHTTNNFRNKAREGLFKYNWDAQPFMTRILEFGAELTFRKKRADLYWALSNSNGRGLDFIKVYKDFGAGVRFSL